MADLDTLANDAIRRLKAFKQHLADGDRSRQTLVGIARHEWSGRHRDEFEGGLRVMASQSQSTQENIDALISKIKRELEAAKGKQAGGH